MEYKAIKCPNCGADVDFDESREFMFCQYCGSKIERYDPNAINININSTHTERHVNGFFGFMENRMEKAEKENQAFVDTVSDPMTWLIIIRLCLIVPLAIAVIVFIIFFAASKPINLGWRGWVLIIGDVAGIILVQYIINRYNMKHNLK